MHERIERGIGDGECKKIFENEYEQRTKKLRKKIGRRFNECKESFIEEIKKDIEQFEERIKDSLIMLDRINIDSGFDFSFNIDSGINKIGLFASIGGLGLLGIFNAWNPMGWLALTAGIITGLVGIARSMWSFFSSRYKRSQQRKKVNKNLNKACEKIAENVKSRIESYKKGALGMIEELNAGFNKLVNHYERMKGQLKEAHEKLGYISHSINLTISKQGACNEE